MKNRKEAAAWSASRDSERCFFLDRRLCRLGWFLILTDMVSVLLFSFCRDFRQVGFKRNLSLLVLHFIFIAWLRRLRGCWVSAECTEDEMVQKAMRKAKEAARLRS